VPPAFVPPPPEPESEELLPPQAQTKRPIEAKRTNRVIAAFYHRARQRVDVNSSLRHSPDAAMNAHAREIVERGYTVFERAYDPAWVDEIRTEIEEIYRELGSPEPYAKEPRRIAPDAELCVAGLAMHHLVARRPRWAESLFRPEIIESIRAAIGADAELEVAGCVISDASPFLTNDDVADVLEIASARIIAILRKKGVITHDRRKRRERRQRGHRPRQQRARTRRARRGVRRRHAPRRSRAAQARSHQAARRPRARAHEGALRRCARLLVARRNDGERRGCRGTRGLVQVCLAPADRPGPHPARR
jgi:hypothetical protein